MTRIDLERANDIVRGIDKINRVIKEYREAEKIYLAPEKVEMDGGFTRYVKSDFVFTGELRDKIITVLINERDRLEEELASL